MALNLNNIILAGHLTRDPQVKSIANDRTVANFGLAVNRRYKSPEGELKEDSTFVEVEAWGRTAELVGQYLVKGSPCFLEGRLKMDSWQDKDGNQRSRLKVVAENVQFIGNKPKTAGAEPAMAGAGAAIASRVGEDQPPF